MDKFNKIKKTKDFCRTENVVSQVEQLTGVNICSMLEANENSEKLI